MTKFKVVFAVVVLVALLAALVVQQRRADTKLRARDQTVVVLNEQVVKLSAENETLSSQVAESKERGKSAPEGGAAYAWIRLGREVEHQGLLLANQSHDGVTVPDTAGGTECHSLERYPGRPELYAYFRIDPAFKDTGSNAVIVEVEYFDADPGGHFRLDYDSYDESNRSMGAYTQSKEKVYLKGTERWRKARFLLDDGRFEGRENDQSDFRVTVVGGRFFVRAVKVMKE